MNKTLFLQQMERFLISLPANERADILRDFEEHFAEAAMSGMSEQETLAALGSPEEIARQMLSESQSENKDDEGGAWHNKMIRVLKRLGGEWLDTVPLYIERSYEVEGINRIRVICVTEDVEITTHQGTDISITLEGDVARNRYPDIELKTSLQGAELLIEVRHKRSGQWLRIHSGRSLNLAVAIPADLQVDIRVDATTADVTMRQLCSKSLAVSTTTGDIDIYQCTDADLALETTTGDHNIFGQYREVNVSATTGDVEFEGQSHNLRVILTTGDIHAHLNDAPRRTNIKTTTGNIDIRVDQLPVSGELNMETVTGELLLGIPEMGTRKEKRRLTHYFGSESGPIFDVHCTTGDIQVKIGHSAR